MTLWRTVRKSSPNPGLYVHQCFFFFGEAAGWNWFDFFLASRQRFRQWREFSGITILLFRQWVRDERDTRERERASQRDPQSSLSLCIERDWDRILTSDAFNIQLSSLVLFSLKYPIKCLQWNGLPKRELWEFVVIVFAMEQGTVRSKHIAWRDIWIYIVDQKVDIKPR